MGLLEGLTLAYQSLRHTLPQLWRPKLWLWVLPLAAAQVAAVLLLWHVAHPAISWLAAPLVTRMAGSAALHYPRTFELMPALFHRIDLPVGLVLGAIGIGAATPAFAARFEGRPVAARAALAEAFRRAPALVVALLPLQLVPALLAGPVAEVLAARGGIVARLSPILVVTASLAVQAAGFYAAALVMIGGRSAVAALRALPGTWRAGFLPALFAGVATLVLLTPLQFPGLTTALLVERGRPELAGWLMLLHVGAGWLNAFILTGAATLLYLSVVRPHEGRA